MTMQPPSAQPMARPPADASAGGLQSFDTGSANNRGGPPPGAGGARSRG